jgi:hypothetical protein
MTERLASTLRALLGEGLPSLFGGATPPVQLAIVEMAFTMDAHADDAEAGAPRIDDQTDLLPFNVAVPAGPYTLSKPPAPGARRVRLVTASGDRIPLSGSEIHWDPVDSAVFTLVPRPGRDLTHISNVEILYGVVGVFVKAGLTQAFGVQLQAADAAQLAQAEALAVSVLLLNRKRIIDGANASFSDGVYGAQITVHTLKFVRGTSPAANTRLLEFSAELELKATRALAADEGRPITRIASPGRPADADRPVDIDIKVDT